MLPRAKPYTAVQREGIRAVAIATLGTGFPFLNLCHCDSRYHNSKKGNKDFVNIE
ncbi:MAG: hypothetical protein ACI9L6_000226 [Flavobacterium sp.]|jgi:hypothetical protein